jgi:hypothetical protein
MRASLAVNSPVHLTFVGVRGAGPGGEHSQVGDATAQALLGQAGLPQMIGTRSPEYGR